MQRWKAIIALALALVFAGVGNVCLAKGMQGVGPLTRWDISYLGYYFAGAVANPWIILGILSELVYFLSWLAVLSASDVSWAVPMNAVEYLVVALMAIFLLGEEISLSRWGGIFLISAGVVFMMKSWKAEEAKGEENEYTAGETVFSEGR